MIAEMYKVMGNVESPEIFNEIIQFIHLGLQINLLAVFTMIKGQFYI